MKCIFCGKEITKEQCKKARRGNQGGHLKKLKYCSKRCIKRAWHYKNNPLKKNFKDSATYRGRYWEKFVHTKLKGSIYCNKEIFNNKGYDILWNNKKIDVKSKNMRLNRGYKEWSFSRENKNTEYYLCVCLIKNKFERAYLIPENKFGKSGITISFNTKKFKKHQINL